MSIPIYDVDSGVINALPPNKRKPKWILFMQSMAYYLRRLQSFFRYFMGGSIDTGYWSNIITYSNGDLVRDISGVYESQSDGNLNNPLSNTTFWFKVLDSFIGASERVKYNGRYLYLTWALNRYFNTTFRQPIYPAPYDFGLGGGTFSDIYITTDTPSSVSFTPFERLQQNNTVYEIPAGHYLFEILVIGTASSYSYTIHIPIAVYNAIGTTGAIRESIVRHFVDGLNTAGITYSVSVY